MNSEDFRRRAEELIEKLEAAKPRDPHAYVGTLIRPPRVVTVGRRRADRWLVRCAFLLFFAMAIFIVYTSVQQNIRADTQEQIIRNQECYALRTQAFEISVTDYLLAQPGMSTLSPEESQRLQDIQSRLRLAQAQQIAQSDGITRSCLPQ